MLGLERARDPNENLLLTGLYHTRRDDGILGLQRGHERRPVDAETCQLFGREFHVDALVLRPENVDLRDVGLRQKLFADLIHIVPELPVGESIRGEAVDNAVGIAELVVEAGADNSLRQCAADVAHLLANLVPDVRHLRRRRRVLEVDENRGLACGRVALQVVQAGRLLERAFDAVGDLFEGIFDRGTGPGCLHHHGLHSEVRILAAPEPDVGPNAREGDHQHKIGHQRAMPDRPFGKIETVHDAPPMMLTF